MSSFHRPLRARLSLESLDIRDLCSATVVDLTLRPIRFASTGELVNFQSDDRARSESDGTFTPRRFSTLVLDYRDFRPVRLIDDARTHRVTPR